jgi:small-conductance mechanosensitive channel
MSAQATLSDVFAGLGLNIAKQFSEGDLIHVYGMGDVIGKVEDINWRFVNFLTPEGNNLSIPNSVVAKQPIANLSRPHLTRGIKITLPMPDNVSPDTVKQILVSAALQSFKVSKEHPPVASLLQMKGGENLYQLSYSTKEPDENIVSDEIQSIIWYQLRRKEIKTPETTPSRPIEIITARLKKMDLFSFLNEEEISLLAESCGFHYYGPPERILEQGSRMSPYL